MPDASAPLDPRAPVSAGDVIAGKYLVEGVLAIGGMGAILRAWHKDLEQRVAIKVMLRELATNPEAEARFLREARASVKLRSEHVARVLDVSRLESGEPYMVMELLEGKDLSVILAQRGPLPVEEAVDLVLQAAEAVAEAHSVGIIHRDLKPPNLFLTHDAYGAPVIKVLDFGISKLSQPDSPNTGPGLTGISVVMGTPNYMSPEQMRSARNADARSDIWSLGAILYELLTGKLAFEGDGLTAVIAAVLTQPTPRARLLRPEVPQELDQVLARCLDKEPDARYATVAELIHAAAPFGSARSQVSRERVKLEPRVVPARTIAGARPALQIVTSDDDEVQPPVHSQPTHVAWGNAPVSADEPQPAKRRGALPWIAAGVVAAGTIIAWVAFGHGSKHATSAQAPMPVLSDTAAVPSLSVEAAIVPAPVQDAASQQDSPNDPSRTPRARELTARAQPVAGVKSASPAQVAASSPTATPPTAKSAVPAATAESIPTQPQPTAVQPAPARTITDFGGRE